MTVGGFGGEAATVKSSGAASGPTAASTPTAQPKRRQNVNRRSMSGFGLKGRPTFLRQVAQTGTEGSDPDRVEQRQTGNDRIGSADMEREQQSFRRDGGVRRPFGAEHRDETETRRDTENGAKTEVADLSHDVFLGDEHRAVGALHEPDRNADRQDLQNRDR